MRPGDRIGGRFEVLRRVGMGGMGEVYEAVDSQSGETVALKLLLGTSHRDRIRFDREASALAELDHPAIVRHVSHGTTEGDLPYLVMEWLAGEDLASLLRRRRLDVAEVISLARRIAAALAEAHRRNIVHRDLKPSNIFIVGGVIENAKLLDFGVAWLADRTRMTQTGGLVGTLGYMAPEQASRQANLTPAADIFALGCVLFEALSGRRAFWADNAPAVLAKLVFDDPPPLREVRPDVPAGLAALVARMLSKDPLARPRDGAALLGLLNALSTEHGHAEGAGGAGAERPQALGSVERRTVCIVLLGKGVLEGADASFTDGTLTDEVGASLVAAITRAARQAGGHSAALADGSFAIALTDTGVFKDRATIAARLALSLQALAQDRPIALATGRAESVGGAPFGDAIERAAKRLQESSAMQVKGRRTIAIDDVTAALLDTRFEVQSGEVGPVLVAERGLTDTARSLLGRPTPFVGRQRELSAIEHAFTAAVEEPAAQVVLVTAPAGMGKSRLAHEFLAHLRQRDETADVWVGRGDPLRSRSSFSLLGQALRGAFDIAGTELLEERREKLRAGVSRCVAGEERSRIAAFLGEIVAVPFADGDSIPLRTARRDAMLMAEQMRRAFEDFIVAACSQRPVVLLLEDLHWGDVSSVRFIDAALRATHVLPFFVLALARPEIQDVFPTLWAERGLQQLRIQPLARMASERLVREVLGDVPDARVEQLVNQADGNAFFLEEMIRASAGGTETLPETLVAMVQSRLEALEPDARKVLRAASVFGEIFWTSGVTHLLGESKEKRGSDRLAQLVEGELLVQRRASRFPADPEFAFRHMLLREGTYALLTEDDRAVGHRLAGEWLETHGENDPVILAEHFERGREPTRASRYWLAAADRAHQGNDTAATYRHARRGLACDPPPETRTALLGIICEGYGWSNDTSASPSEVEEVLRLAPPGSKPWAQGAIAHLSRSILTGNLAELISMAGRLETVEPLPDAIGGLLIALLGAVTALDFGTRLDVSDRLVNRMHVLLDRYGEREPLLRAWVAGVHAVRDAYARNDPWTGFRNGEMSAKICRENEHRRGMLSGHSAMGTNLWLLGAWDEAERVLEVAAEAFEDLGVVSSNPLFCLSALYAERGALDDARRAAARLVASGQARRIPLDEGRGRWALARVFLRAGETAAAEREILAAQQVLAAVPLDLPGVRATLAAIRLAQGQTQTALLEADRAFEQEQTQHASGFARGTLIGLVRAECLHAAGRREDARNAITALRQHILAIAGRIEDPAYRSSFLDKVPENVRALQLVSEWSA